MNIFFLSFSLILSDVNQIELDNHITVYILFYLLIDKLELSYSIFKPLFQQQHILV